jgi:hypothetical protein
MDPALPPGGLQRIFQQYDAIRIHSTRDDGPAPWEPEPDVEPVASNATPPGAPTPASKPTEVTGFITPISQDDGKVTVERPGPPQQVLTDSNRERPKGRPKSWTEDAETKKREAVGRERMQFAIDYPNRGTFADDEDGMTKAYGDATATGVYYDPRSRSMYVKGTVPTSAKDWWDDVSKIPAWGDIHDADRMQQAEAAYENLIGQGKPVDRVVGHSLGGSVALQLQKDKDIAFSRTFGAPVFQLSPFERTAERYRHPLDPVSVLDRSATNIRTLDFNTHAYGGFTNNTSVLGKYLGA